MSKFHLEFASELASVSSPNGRITVEHSPLESSQPAKNDDANAIAALDLLATRFNELEIQAMTRIDRFEQQLIAMAFDVARAVLCDEEILIQKRVEQYVRIALDQMRPDIPKIVYVHPKCVAPIKRWIEQSAISTIEVKEDGSISPGDCRIESDETGVSATLDAFLDAGLNRFFLNAEKQATN